MFLFFSLLIEMVGTILKKNICFDQIWLNYLTLR